MDISRIIKEKRESLNLTMKELADKVGVSEATISRWESGEIDNMRRKNIYNLSLVLNVSPSVILGREEPRDNISESLLSKFNQLTPANQTTVMGMIDLLLSQQSAESKKTDVCG